jgi:hypothetical protein
VPANAGETSTDLRSLRFRLVVFLVRMWLCIDWWRVTLPVPVTLKRFAAPLCVFCFGKGVSFLPLGAGDDCVPPVFLTVPW